MPPIDRKPGKPEVYYFDDSTREQVLSKQRTPVTPAKVKKATKTRKKG